jgi:hypothetical protein
MRHGQTYYRDILMDDNANWITRRGLECEVCGDVAPCPKDGQEAEEEDWDY